MKRNLRVKRSLLDMDTDQGTEVGTEGGVAALETNSGSFTKKEGEAMIEAAVDCGIGASSGGEVDPGSSVGSMPEPASPPASNPRLAMYTKDGKQLLNPRLLGRAPKKVPSARYMTINFTLKYL